MKIWFNYIVIKKQFRRFTSVVWKSSSIQICIQILSYCFSCNSSANPLIKGIKQKTENQAVIYSILSWWHIGVSTYGTNSLATLIRATLLLLHSGIVNLLWDAHTVLESHRGSAAFFYLTHCHNFPLFLFMFLSYSSISFLRCLFSC